MDPSEQQRNLEEAYRYYGEYQLGELRQEMENMEEVARGTMDEKLRESCRRQVFLMRILFAQRVIYWLRW